MQVAGSSEVIRTTVGRMKVAYEIKCLRLDKIIGPTGYGRTTKSAKEIEFLNPHATTGMNEVDSTPRKSFLHHVFH
jgi:hypothetical protein